MAKSERRGQTSAAGGANFTRLSAIRLMLRTEANRWRRQLLLTAMSGRMAPGASSFLPAAVSACHSAS